MPNVFDQFDKKEPNVFDQFDSIGGQEVTNDFIPTDENLALEQARVDAIPERTFGEKAEGVFETVKTLGTGATTGALGFGAGTLTGIIGELTGRLKPGEGLEEAQALAAKFTDLPESEAGQEYVKGIGETLGALPPVGLTGGVTPKIKLPKLSSPLAKKIITSSKESTKKSFERNMDSTKFTPRIFGMVKEAKKQGFDEGMLKVVANSTPLNKRKFSIMVSKLEKGMTDEEYKAAHYPSEVAGESLLREIDFIRSNNKQAGKQLDRVSKALKGKDVDVEDVTSRFISDLQDIGVSFDENGKINFDGSRIRTVSPSRKIITDVIDELSINKIDDALDAHEFKGFLDENINYGKKQEGLSGKAERIVSEFRRGINESIGGKYKAYNEANTRFSDTIKVIDELQDTVGKKLDMDGPNADKAFGIALNTLLSRNKGRANMMTVVENIKKTSDKYGGAFEDNILAQMLFADELETMFQGGGRGSLRGQVGKAGVDTAIDVSQMTIPGALAVGAKALNKKRLGINEANQLKAIKKLLKSK
mgnify:CR=1 FL=1